MKSAWIAISHSTRQKWGEVVQQISQKTSGFPSLWTPTTSHPSARSWFPRITWGAHGSFIPCQRLCSSYLWPVQALIPSRLHVLFNTRSSGLIWTTSWWTWPWQTSWCPLWAPSPASTALPSDTWFLVHWGARLKDLQQHLVVRNLTNGINSTK